jgi:hypothetical protein
LVVDRDLAVEHQRAGGQLRDGGGSVPEGLPRHFRLLAHGQADVLHRRVPADDVRALYGVLNINQNVSKAVITTTALFAPGVQEEFKPVMPNRLELRCTPGWPRIRRGGPATWWP